MLPRSNLSSLALFAAFAIGSGVMGWASVARADTIELKNDELDQQGNVAFQTGFVAGEMGAATLGPVADAYEVRKVRFVFGPDQGTGGGGSGGAGGAGGGPGDYQITLRIYQDDGATDPGTLLHENTYVMVPSSEAMQEIDLSAGPVALPAGSSFRVGIEMHHDGLPSLARDDDGCDAGRNWIYGSISSGAPSWNDFCALGSQGDFIIRAEVETGVSSSGTGGSGTGGGGVGGSGVGGAASCSPTESVACIGPDGCSGSQVCADDGSGFGVCSCGDVTEEAESDDGCGCHLPGGNAADGAALAALTLLLMAAASRRRRPAQK